MKQPKEKVRKRDLEATRERILTAGRREFSEHGLQGARVDRIALKAKANKYMIYYIFGNKEGLYLACLESLWETKTILVDEPLLTGPITIEHFTMLTALAMDMFAQNHETARMLLHDLVSGGEHLRKLKEKRPELFTTFNVLIMLLNQMMEAGTIKKIDPEKAILFLAVHLISFTAVSPQFEILVPRDSDKYESVNDFESWKAFVGEVIRRVLSVT
ncbi:MAG TPA: TetR/AcrR family transcriptional regulator [bacterium]|nr:TetR/AcrR family transcriptional regulator [bacterium]